jgi:basic membrane lipoprotein Med (substrate-binding protein (PBP1-ABC) superfamily)
MASAIEDFAAWGANVIIANSFDHVPQADKGAEDHPDITFLVCSGQKKEPNMGSFFGNLEQAWFVAGRLAARKTRTKRLGFIGSYVTPEVVRHLNAFALGARSEDLEIKVEIRWLGFWYDPDFASPQFEYTPKHMGSKAKKTKMTGEEYLIAKLVDSGADVIGHQLDNQLVSRYVSKHTDAGTMLDDDEKPIEVFTIANDNRYGWRNADMTPMTNAIGAVYWNWETVYTKVLSDIHRKKWVPSDIMEALTENTDVSTVGFELSPGESEITDIALRKLLNEAQNAGPGAVFRGPYDTTGQRASMASGSTIEPGEYLTMCWFVDNIVERSNPNDPTSADQPAKVPDGTHLGKLGDKKEPAEGTPRQPTQAPEVLVTFVPEAPEAMWNCRANQYPPLD